MCGEQTLMAEDGKMNKGSPPRVRGTVGTVHVGREVGRITPACAGNSGDHVGAHVGG